MFNRPGESIHCDETKAADNSAANEQSCEALLAEVQESIFSALQASGIYQESTAVTSEPTNKEEDLISDSSALPTAVIVTPARAVEAENNGGQSPTKEYDEGVGESGDTKESPAMHLVSSESDSLSSLSLKEKKQQLLQQLYQENLLPQFDEIKVMPADNECGGEEAEEVRESLVHVEDSTESSEVTSASVC